MYAISERLHLNPDEVENFSPQRFAELCAYFKIRHEQEEQARKAAEQKANKGRTARPRARPVGRRR